MRLPRYVALDRWVRRHPSTTQTLKGIGALAIILALVTSFKDVSAVWGLTIIAFFLTVYFAVIWLYRDALTKAADKWREEH